MSKQVPHQRSLRLQPLLSCPFPPCLSVMQDHGDTDQNQEGGNTHRPEPANNSDSSSNKPTDKVGCEYCGWWHPNSPFPIPNCSTCGDTPSYHHGSCCPKSSPGIPTRKRLRTLSSHSEPQPEVKKLRQDVDLLTQRVDHHTEMLAYQTARLDNIAGYLSVVAQEAKTVAGTVAQAATLNNTILQQLLDNMARPAIGIRDPPPPPPPPGERRTATQPHSMHQGEPSYQHLTPHIDAHCIHDIGLRDGTLSPLCSNIVDKGRHDAICSLLNIQAFNIPKDMSQSHPFTGLSYREWWHEISATHTTAQWRTRLLAHGTPAPQVHKAEKEQIGAILFQHFDSTGRYHEIPLQDLPPNVNTNTAGTAVRCHHMT